jgi:sec-independent protein translocase protein TatA
MFGLTPWHLVLVLGVALIVLGPGKLPETGAAIGKAIRGFQDAVAGRDEPVAAPVAPAAPPSAASSIQSPSSPVASRTANGESGETSA